MYFVKEKSDALYVFKKFKNYVEKRSGYVLKTLRTNKDGEFISHKFNVFCEENGKVHAPTKWASRVKK